MTPKLSEYPNWTRAVLANVLLTYLFYSTYLYLVSTYIAYFFYSLISILGSMMPNAWCQLHFSLCRLRLLFLVNKWLQMVQRKLFSPEWIRIWSSIWFFFFIILEHRRQAYSFGPSLMGSGPSCNKTKNWTNILVKYKGEIVLQSDFPWIKNDVVCSKK